jgi:hypothetical protein
VEWETHKIGPNMKNVNWEVGTINDLQVRNTNYKFNSTRPFSKWQSPKCVIEGGRQQWAFSNIIYGKRGRTVMNGG